MQMWTTLTKLLNVTDTSPKRTAARLSLTGGMILLGVEVSQYLLGGGFSPILLGAVLGYGLTDKFIAAAARGRYRG